jgi:hypothetical protein
MEFDCIRATDGIRVCGGGEQLYSSERNELREYQIIG